MDTKRKAQFSPALLHPRYWPTWLWFGLWWLVAQLPYRLQMKFGELLGLISYRVLKRRRFIARRNIELCFPRLSEIEREKLVRDNFIATATAVFESGMAWFWPHRRLKRMYVIEGLEHLDAPQAEGRGMILLTLHFTTLELLGAAMSSELDSLAITYRPHRNQVYDWIQSRQRARRSPSAEVIAAGDVRAMVRHLRKGHALGYLPDQDHGPKHSVFAPLFGIPAATVTGLSRLATMGRVPAIPVESYRREDGKGYVFRVLPPLEDFPSGNDQRDARKLNEHVERCIVAHPEQYLWVHRRFKSRPPGEPDLYGLPRRPRRRRERARSA